MEFDEFDLDTIKKIESFCNNIIFLLLAIIQVIVSYGWYNKWEWFDNLTFSQSFFVLYCYGLILICKLIACLIVAPNLDNFFDNKEDDDDL